MRFLLKDYATYIAYLCPQQSREKKMRTKNRIQKSISRNALK